MNEQVKQMEREVEEEDRAKDAREQQKTEADRERDIKEREQNIEEDKGRSTKNITVKISAKLSNALQMLNCCCSVGGVRENVEEC